MPIYGRRGACAAMVTNTNFVVLRYIVTAAERDTEASLLQPQPAIPVYAAGRESQRQSSRSDPYQQRMALVHARVFEEMKGADC